MHTWFGAGEVVIRECLVIGILPRPNSCCAVALELVIHSLLLLLLRELGCHGEKRLVYFGLKE